jgi:hypothetical protein
LPTASKLTIEGSLKPGNTGDFTVSLQELDLPTFSPYSMNMAGVSFEAGQVSLQTKLQTHGATMQVDNDIVIKKLGVSLRDPQSFQKEFGMPIDLVVALLSDPAGDIKLKIPVRMDEKGITVAAGSVIASALRAAILGAVTSPLKLIGAGLGGKAGAAGGGGTLSIAPLKSPPGSAELAPDAPARIDGFVKLLAQRPNMGLMLRGRTSVEDRPLVAEQILVERVQGGQGLPDLAGAGLFERRRISHVLSQRAKGKNVAVADKDRALFDRYIATVEIPEERLDTLAKSRAEKAKEMLAAKGVNPKNITLGNRETVGEAGVVISFGQQTAGRPEPAKPTKKKKGGT